MTTILTQGVTKYYHLRPHQGMDNEIPLRRYEQALQALSSANKALTIPRDPRTFLIDFLPVIRRSLQRDGITIDHITYYSNSLRPWIQLRDQPSSLLIRRDPRDLSRIFVLDAENNRYLEVPYRILSRPSITLWEHKLARKRLREQRRTAIDEASLFAAIDEMREIERKSETLTRTARRNRTRRKIDVPKADASSTPTQTSSSIAHIGPARPFEDIESW